MSITNPFSPPDINELQAFGESVKQKSTLTERVTDTAGAVRKAVGGTLAGVVSIPLLVTEKTLNVAGSGLGVVGGGLFKIGNISNKTQTGIHRVLSGSMSSSQ